MEETKLQHVNTFKIVGRLIKAEVKLDTSSKTGQPYCSATATIQSIINGINCEYEVNFYASQMTGAGKVSTLYTTYSKMNELEGHKVEISGSIRENRYFSTTLNQLVSTQELAGRFIKGVSETTSDDATWEMSGFIAKNLVEKKNKQGEVYRYDLTLGGVGYNGSVLSLFTLHVDPSRRDIINGVENYEVGQTVRLNGSLVFKVETVTSESKNEGGFGQGVVRTYTNKQKNFFIEGGSAPITDETKFDSLTISDLISAYKAHDVELSERSKGKEVAVESTATITKKQTSLI